MYNVLFDIHFVSAYNFIRAGIHPWFARRSTNCAVKLTYKKYGTRSIASWSALQTHEEFYSLLIISLREIKEFGSWPETRAGFWKVPIPLLEIISIILEILFQSSLNLREGSWGFLNFVLGSVNAAWACPLLFGLPLTSSSYLRHCQANETSVKIIEPQKPESALMSAGGETSCAQWLLQYAPRRHLAHFLARQSAVRAARTVPKHCEMRRVWTSWGKKHGVVDKDKKPQRHHPWLPFGAALLSCITDAERCYPAMLCDCLHVSRRANLTRSIGYVNNLGFSDVWRG